MLCGEGERGRAGGESVCCLLSPTKDFIVH